MALFQSECKVHPSVYHLQLNSLTLSNGGGKWEKKTQIWGEKS